MKTIIFTHKVSFLLKLRDLVLEGSYQTKLFWGEFKLVQLFWVAFGKLSWKWTEFHYDNNQWYNKLGKEL